MEPDYLSLGLSDCMGPKLREEVERQLIKDFETYVKVDRNVMFDWSESCNEGKRANVLDGAVEDFSSIRLFDNLDNFIAEGWMNFIFEKSLTLFIVYWDLLDVQVNDGLVSKKDKFGIPDHIYYMLPNELKGGYEKERMFK